MLTAIFTIDRRGPTQRFEQSLGCTISGAEISKPTCLRHTPELSPLPLDDARRLMQGYVDHHNDDPPGSTPTNVRGWRYSVNSQPPTSYGRNGQDMTVREAVTEVTDNRKFLPHLDQHIRTFRWDAR